MGVNLIIEVEDWDTFANGGMKRILNDNIDFPKIDKEPYNEDNEDLFRPANFEIWRKSIIKLDCNVDMWLKGLEFLENNPDEYIHASR